MDRHYLAPVIEQSDRDSPRPSGAPGAARAVTARGPGGVIE
jgi:hypothetical protein